MIFTEDQNKVLDNHSNNLLVSASAGSGKTATIIEKISRIISEKNVDIEDILCITFTESASVEMKIRLKDRLKDLANVDIEVRKKYEKLPLADISTLHGFCSKMIRKFFYLLDIKPNFIVLDDNDSKYLKVNALEKTLKYYAKNEDDDFVLLSSYFDGGRNFDSLKSNILSLFEFLCAVEDKNKYINTIATSLYNSELSSNIACEMLNDYMCVNYSYLVRELKNYLLLSQQKKSFYFEGFINNLIKLFEQVDASNGFLTNHKIVLSIELPRLNTRSLKGIDKEFSDTFKPIWEIIKEKNKTIKQCILDKDETDLSNDLTIAKKAVEKFLEVEQTFEKYYEKLKEKRNGLDFNDLEKNFLQLLTFDEIKQTLNYKYIFVDEYQDINLVQERIIRELSNSSQVVMVGDIKQSIYGFRNSTPEIFVDKSIKFIDDNEKGTLINLNENFRSNPVILNFVNSIFERCMGLDFGGVDYNKTGKLRGMTEYLKVSDIPEVEIDIVDSKKDEEKESVEIGNVYSVLEDKTKYDSVLSHSKREAMIVAKRIVSIYNKDYYDAKEKKTKKIKFSDIAILCRSNGFLKDVAKCLLEYKIPIATNLVDNIYKNIDVEVLLSLLKIINNFHDDKSLTIFMTSYFGKFSFDDLSIIRQSNDGEKFFYNCVKKYSENEQKDEGIVKKIDDLFKFIQDVKNELVYKSINETLVYICNKYEYFNYLLSLPDGANRYKVVKDFVNSFDNVDYNYNLTGFIDFVDNYAYTSKFKTTFAGGSDSVKMGTIHSSKGLEYPIVFVVGCGKLFSSATFREEIIKDKDMGLGMSTFNVETYQKSLNLARSAITIKKRRQERAEELRLLYVALTRAKNHLFITFNTNLSSVDRVKNVDDAKGVNNYVPWILSSLTDLNFNNLIKNKKNLVNEINGNKVNVHIYKDDDFETIKEKNTDFDFSHYDDKIVNEIQKQINFTFKNKRSIALKNSVSSLLKEYSEQGESLNYSPKKLEIFEHNSDVSKSELGTVYHKILEKVNFEKPFDLDDFNKIVKELNLGEDVLSLIKFDEIYDCVNTIKNMGKIKVRKEVPFLSYIPYNEIFDGDETSKVLIQGVADLIVNVGEKYYLIDYKTTNVKSPDQLVEKYSIQLKLYKICLEKALNKHFECSYIYSFCLKKLIKVL